MINIILLSGGSGERLWPLSDESKSKQFLMLLTDDKGNKESMIQRTFRQIKEANLDANIVIATNKKQVNHIKEQIKDDVDLVIEPEKRNTYPAILLSCAYLKYVKGIKDDDSVIVLPVDPYTETSFFERLKEVDKSIQDGKKDLTLIGIKPKYATDKYGYIECDDNDNVIRFVEKPSIDVAEELLKRNTYWNAGVFGFKLGYISKLFNNYSSYDNFLEDFSKLKVNSFDYEIVEKTDSINVVSYNDNWKDLGTWDDLSKEIKNSYSQNVLGEDNESSLIINETDKPVVVMGIKNSIIVINEKGILISKKEMCNNIKSHIKDYGKSK